MFPLLYVVRLTWVDQVFPLSQSWFLQELQPGLQSRNVFLKA